jgi:YD repeat-containing protein
MACRRYAHTTRSTGVGTYWDRGGSAYTLAYDSTGHLASHTLPQIVAEGQAVRPVIRFRSREAIVLPQAGRGTFSSPGLRVTPDTIRAAVTDPKGNTTRMAFDAFGSPTRIEDPLGRVTKMERDEHSRVTRAISAFGDTVIYEYTFPGPSPTKATDRRAGTAVVVEYTCDARLRSSTGGARSAYAEYEFDGEDLPGCGPGKLIAERIGSASYFYDFAGYNGGWRPGAVYGPGGITKFRFGASGTWQNTEEVSNSDGNRSEYRHDEYGRVAVMRNARGDSVRVEYDGLNRPLRVFDPAGNATVTRYGALSADTVVDAKGQTYTVTRNALGWVTARTDPRGKVETYAYDANGNVKAYTDRRGKTVTFGYDGLDRITWREADGKRTTYEYDPGGTSWWPRTRRAPIRSAWTGAPGRRRRCTRSLAGTAAGTS